MNLTTLDALLIFLVGHKSQSGYDIRQLFQSTPLGLFSDSPGSIYPALARLEARGLLSSATAAGGRRRRSYARSADGERALLAWLGAPIARGDVEGKKDDIALRFVMIAETMGLPRAAQFLSEAEAAYASRLSDLETFVAGPGAAMSRAARGAVELGIRTCRLRIQWCRDMRKSRARS